MYIEGHMELLRFHHIGCAVRDIEDTLRSFRPFFPRISVPVAVGTQNVRVCFVEIMPGAYIELVEAIGHESAIGVMLKRGISFYHAGFLVDSLDQALRSMASHNYRFLERFSSEAFGGRQCAFLMSDTMQLIEIIESGYDVMNTETPDVGH